MERPYVFQFGMFKVLRSEGRLLYRGFSREIAPLEFKILVTLLENEGHVVTDEELMRIVWGESEVNRAKLFTTISNLRTKIGDIEVEMKGKRRYKYIERVSKKGYRFKALVKICVEQSQVTYNSSVRQDRADSQPTLASCQEICTERVKD